MLKYKEIEYQTHPQVYEPSDDTFLLAENLQVKRMSNTLEIGTGTGICLLKVQLRNRRIQQSDRSDQRSCKEIRFKRYGDR